MQTKFFALAAGFVLLTLSAAHAGDTDMAADAAKTSAAETARTKLICKPVIHNGSLVVGKRECHTKAGWTRIRLRNQQKINEFQTRGLQNGYN